MDTQPPSASRREFLKRLGVLGATVALGGSIIPGCATAPPRTGLPSVPKARWDPAAADLGSVPVGDSPALFRSVFLGGFECSTHVREDGKRLDLLASTRHDQFASEDYARLKSLDMHACRDAARWHLIETSPGEYSFKSLVPMARAAQQHQMQVIWDLMHYGWPDDLDIYSIRFPGRFARYAAATVRVLMDFTPPNEPLFITPVNEISFLSWAGGDYALLNPFDRGRGYEVKRQLARASLLAMNEIWAICPQARFIHCDPLVNIVGNQKLGRRTAEAYRMAQFQGLDMLSGEVEPSLGGAPKFVDIIGLNYYRNNQTYYDGHFIFGDDKEYKPLSGMIAEVWERYRRPMLIAETGIEDDERVPWLRYICGEVGLALREGVPIHGITWYPIVDHPGWADDRHCRNGVWGYADDNGDRPIYAPVAKEILRQTPAMARLRTEGLRRAKRISSPGDTERLIRSRVLDSLPQFSD